MCPGTYQKSIDYLLHEFDVGSKDAFYFLQELINSSDRRDSLMVESSSCFLDFNVAPDGALWVEVYGNNGLWAISEINLKIGEEILKIAQAGKDFGEIIPTTDKNWDAYTPLGN